jgi:transcription elongation factor Elf1
VEDWTGVTARARPRRDVVDLDIICPGCGSDDHLTGERHDQVITITCGACELTWDRDLSPRCRSCGRTDVYPAARAVWEKSRGSQLSIVSVQTVHLCPDCDAEEYRRARESNTALPPDQNPADGMR